MRKKEREITDIGEIEDIIRKAAVCRIGLADGEEPYIIPVFFGYEKKALYFHCAPEGRKLDIIRKNSRVCFEIDTDVGLIKGEKPCGWSSKYRSVIGVGVASSVEKEEEKIHGLDVLMGHYSDGESCADFPKLDVTTVVRIDVERISGKKAGY
jgi:nitroimidazol reductase NimA-like FMN-containing flavoprotein (pyridoxamine 5'-phosphate oxidase superfamily)